MDLNKDTRVDFTYSFKDDPTDDVHPTDIPLSHVDYQGPSTLFASRVSDRAEAVSPPGPREYSEHTFLVSQLGNIDHNTTYIRVCYSVVNV